MNNVVKLVIIGLAVTIIYFIAFSILPNSYISLVNSKHLLIGILIILSSVLTFQGAFTLMWMLYAWNNPEDTKKYKSPKKYLSPELSFTALIPAKHEASVIGDTIKAINNIKYPNRLKEILVLCKFDDKRTVAKTKKIIKELGQKNIRLITFKSFPINKPHSLNVGLKKAKNQIVVIFDAEDEPHPDIYNIVNTVMTKNKVDVVQSGVQLMNYCSNWFSTLNVLEYFFWFKSGLHFFTNVGKVTPLGGNTVFFKKHWLEKINGWDENCLTEDADIGFRLTLAGAKTKVIYDEKHVTREETPTKVLYFIKQRTRWNQGFLQVFLKFDWIKLPFLKQKATAFYVLMTPIVQTLLLFYMPIGLILSFTQKLPVLVSMISFIPIYLFFLQLLTFIVGLHKFTKAYNLSFSLWMPFKLILTFYPYQLLLMFSSLRAFQRVMFSKNSWEKTLHTNAHRKMTKLQILPKYAK